MGTSLSISRFKFAPLPATATHVIQFIAALIPKYPVLPTLILFQSELIWATTYLSVNCENVTIFFYSDFTWNQILESVFHGFSSKFRVPQTVLKILCVEITEFFVIQNLREIKICKSRVTKSAILTHWQALNFNFHEFVYFLKAEIYQINKIESP